MSFIGGVVPCGVCGKRVYGAERADADGQTYHKACMRCAECQCVVKLGSYAALGGKFYCKPHFRQLFARSGNYHGAFEGQADPKSKWLNAMASEVEGQGKELRRVQSHVVSRPPPPRNTTSLLREAEDQFSPTQQARKSLTPDAVPSVDSASGYNKRRSFFERIASGPGTTAKRVFGRSHSKDNHKKQEEEEEAHEAKGKEKDDAAKELMQQQQEEKEAWEREQKRQQQEKQKRDEESAQKAKKEQEERERVEREEREAREKVEEMRREKIEEKRKEREQAEAEAAAKRRAEEQAAIAEREKAYSEEQQREANEKRESEAAAAAAAEKEKREREAEERLREQQRADEERQKRESEAKARAQREREEREEAERKRRQQQEEEATIRREKEEAERRSRAEAAEAKRKAASATAAETKEAPPTNSFSRVKNLTMRFAEQQNAGNGGKDLSIEGLKKEGHFKSIRDRWQFGDFNIPSYKKKEN